MRNKPRLRSPKERAKDFHEVSMGYSPEQAKEEASRCIQCKKPQCVTGCPVNIDIPAFIKLIVSGDPKGALNKIKEKNNLPAVCGRVCPQEDQCEKMCILGKKGEPIAIGYLERFASDYGTPSPTLPLAKGERERSDRGGKVAVVGAGPAGLTCAADLAKAGYNVTLFESLHGPGGVLSYGIPEFRLPKKIVNNEVEYIRSLGVDIQYNMMVGGIFTIKELFAKGYKAIFLGSGAGLPKFMRIPGENLNGVYSANEFLTRINLMKAYLFPDYMTPVRIGKNVAVIGGGNVAMDSARSALRLGADKVTIVYRRSKEEMPARIEEAENALEEGIEFRFLTSPTRIIGDEKGWVKSMECQKMELGEKDESGRRSFIPLQGSEYIMDVDTVIMAIGQSPNPLIGNSSPELSREKWGGVIADPETGQTSIPGVFAGGDIVTGAATVISAMGAGKKAAEAIGRYLGQSMKDEV
ncbi:MAG: NADPH-dependent glutamate synthase [Candidatus Margulisiibacteriota bacterium]